MQPHFIEFITVGFGLILLMFEAFTKGNKSQIGLLAATGLTVILAMLFSLPRHVVPSLSGWNASTVTIKLPASIKSSR